MKHAEVPQETVAWERLGPPFHRPATADVLAQQLGWAARAGNFASSEAEVRENRPAMNAAGSPFLPLRSARDREQLFETVAAASADWLALFDSDRRCRFLSRPLHGLEPDAAIGVPAKDFVP